MILKLMLEVVTRLHVIGSWVSFATAVPVLFGVGRSLYREPEFTIELAGRLAVGITFAGFGALLFYGKVPGWMTDAAAVLAIVGLAAVLLLADYEARVKPQREALAQQKRLRVTIPR